MSSLPRVVLCPQLPAGDAETIQSETIGALVALDREWCEYGDDTEPLEQDYADM